jgi:uncharacterized protein YbjT (DUF2867 family)
VTVLVTGISGFVGSRLAERLVASGHDVRGFARRPQRVGVDVPVVAGDAVTGDGLGPALAGVDVAYYLIHSMETASDPGPFEERERVSAQRFAAAASAAGVSRIVYLGGPEPPGPRSEHLASRLSVEATLLQAVPDAIALRASIVIGARSRSFQFLVRLVERLPVLAIPGWGDHRTAPIDERDIVTMLVRCADLSLTPADRVLDAAGPDVVTYRALIERIAALMLVDRPTVSINVTLTPIAARIAAVIAGEDPELILPLMESLETDLLATGPLAADQLSVRLHTLDAAIEHALGDWERTAHLRAR